MDVEQLMQKALDDNRSADELFESIKQKIQASSKIKLSEKEAIEATRNFIGFCECLMGLGPVRATKLDSDEN